MRKVAVLSAEGATSQSIGPTNFTTNVISISCSGHYKTNQVRNASKLLQRHFTKSIHLYTNFHLDFYPTLLR